ncbi:hypothetical protein ACOSP7_007629 [Xanthoceras sorbifolium]|uniref:Pentatricopeptide repeat-containing protein n=1 Tax=Xanthoceras sorbifolium TaxID=99658 RepID=A0ABQ8IAU3_9ROSI|nr:hypothetical protein JRO89_XS03G0204700 [Xanthoceras sorbifolium]
MMSNSKPISPFKFTSLIRLQKDPKLALELFRNPNPDRTLQTKPFRYTIPHYDIIITRLGRAKMFDEMEQILHQLKNDTRVTPKEIILCNVISFYGRARLHDHALRTFDEMPGFRVERTVKSFNTLLNALLKCRKFDKMKETFENMEKHTGPDACSYNILINGCVMGGRLKGAWNVFGEMLKRGLNPSVVTFGTLVYGLCSDSRLEEALKLKEDMMTLYNVRPNGHIYASLIKGLCEVGELSSAIGLKQEMVRDKVELDSGIYSTLISAMFKVGRKEEVSGLLEEMRENGCNPDTVTYNVMINGFCNEKDFERAFRMFDEMKERGCKADVVSYNVILGGLCKEGKLSEAKDLFEDMPRQGCTPDVVSYRILFDRLCDGMQFEEAALILDEMIFKGYVPRCDRIHKFVDGLCQSGNAELLWTALNTLVRGNAIDFGIWRMLISKLCKEEEFSNDFQLVETLIVP